MCGRKGMPLEPDKKKLKKGKKDSLQLANLRIILGYLKK